MEFKKYPFLQTQTLKSPFWTLLMQNLLLVFTFALTAFMTGLIWFVQVVHYPIFLKVPPEKFIEFQQTHMGSTGSLVVLPMLLELAASVLMLGFKSGSFTQNLLNYLAFGLLVLAWASTALFSVPAYNALVSQGFEAGVIQKLIATNWIRTLAWTGRTLILPYLVYKRLLNCFSFYS